MSMEVKHLSVGYGSRLVLEDISFHLKKGKILGLIGPNGAGKTTLIRAISGVQEPRAGTILVNGTDLAELSAGQRARLIAVVPQARSLPGAFTGWETVLLGRTPWLNWLGQTSEADDIVVKDAMKMTDTLELMDRRMEELSGGEQQSLLLARALAQSAPILLLDEPTTHLDLHHQVNLLGQVHRLAKKNQLTVIMVLHDLNQVSRFADEVALLVDGRICEQGSPEDVMKAGILSSAFRIGLKVIKNRASRYPVVIPPDPD
jgi:iron complex transport system ATP-binding protein